jgi:DNA polymerase I-like protein with 3'-5' exonuclease and polymerase domains
MRYLGLDLSESKSDDAWRTNYALLEDLPLSDWPQEAIDYALNDAVYTLDIWKIQEERRHEIIAEYGHDPFEVLGFRVRLDFCLHLMSQHGFAIDKERVEQIQAMLDEELSADKMVAMTQAGVLIPACPGRPFKNNPNKFTKPKAESISKTTLQEIVKHVCESNGIEVRETDKGSISTAGDFMEEISHLSPVLGEYVHRQKLQKLVTTELPRMKFEDEIADVVHPMYDCLKATGRTSSYGSKLVPSLNCQNVDPRVRPCYVPRPGTYLFSIDYSQMELGTLAQTNLRLFGYSVMAEKINEGADLHAYLGAQIMAAVDGTNSEHDADTRYEAFLEMKESDPDKFKHFRKLAKPTGLGYPGGLGPATFITYAKATYGEVIDLETAETLREVWFETFPEMREYFNHINRELIDPWNSEKYAYTTPMGMRRAGADYCAAANGLGLQSPSAEGATKGVCRVVRFCWDGRFNPHVRPIAFVHDELIGEVTIGKERMLYDVANIMVEAMREITPDVRVKAEPVLMLAWDKNAEPVFDGEGNLIPWTPQEN